MATNLRPTAPHAIPKPTRGRGGTVALAALLAFGTGLKGCDPNVQATQQCAQSRNCEHCCLRNGASGFSWRSWWNGAEHSCECFGQALPPDRDHEGVLLQSERAETSRQNTVRYEDLSPEQKAEFDAAMKEAEQELQTLMSKMIDASVATLKRKLGMSDETTESTTPSPEHP